jgi:hypothetical protein
MTDVTETGVTDEAGVIDQTGGTDGTGGRRASRRPLVSVVMAVYNGEEWLAEAMRSVLDQTYEHFEFLVVDDGSTDGSAAVVTSFADTRIRLLTNPENLGLVRSLNRALDEARGEYIARMDADDLSHPRRLECQVAFLEEHPDHGLVGCLDAVLDERRQVVGVEPFLLGDTEIRRGLAVKNQFCHGAVMMRSAALGSLRYSVDARHFEDYELWSRLLGVTRAANLPDVLYYYMANPVGISRTRADAMAAGTRSVRKQLLSRGDPPLSMRAAVTSAGRYRLASVDVERQVLPSNLMREYQFFLVFHGLDALRRGHPGGLPLLGLAVVLRPATFVEKLRHR